MLLKERGELGKANLSGYRGRAENGDAKAAIQLVFLLSEMGRLEEAMAVLALPLGHESLASEVFHHLLAEESYALPAPLGRRRRTGYEWAEGLDDAYVKYKIRVMNTL